MERARTGRRQVLRMVGAAGVGLALVAGDSLLRGRAAPGGGTSAPSGAGRLPGLAARPAHAQSPPQSPGGKSPSAPTDTSNTWSQPTSLDAYEQQEGLENIRLKEFGLLGTIAGCASIVALSVTAVAAIGAVTVVGLKRA